MTAIKISLDVALRIIGSGYGSCIRIEGTMMGDTASLSINIIAWSEETSMKNVAKMYHDHLFIEDEKVLIEL